MAGGGASNGARVDVPALPPPPAPSAGHGYADCTLTADTAIRYADTIAALDAAALAYLEDHPRDDSGGGGGRGGQRVAVTRGCGRRLQLTPHTYEQGAILCGLCDTAFHPADVG